MANRKRVLVTGANGVVGQGLVPFLAAQDLSVIAAMRQPSHANHVVIPSVDIRQSPDLADETADWRALFADCDVVVHLAGIAHETASDAAQEAVNHQATRRLVDAAIAAKVTHFIFVSSIRAQVGASSPALQTEESSPQPTSAYGRSKLAAENDLRQSSLPHTILRPVAIQGGRPQGSMLILNKIAGLPLPLPLGSLTAERSLLSIANFCTAVAFAIDNPAAAAGTFVVADPKPVSVRDLVAAERQRAGRAPHLLPLPPVFLKLPLQLLGKGRLWAQIGEPLIVSPAKLISAGWRPIA